MTKLIIRVHCLIGWVEHSEATAWFGETTDPYTGGTTYERVIGNHNWGVGLPGWDYGFRTYVIAGPATPGVTITESGGSTDVAETGGTDSYTVVLNTAPTAPVTITINPGVQVTAMPATLTFTPLNWNTAQSITVTAIDDALVEGAHVGTIMHTSASADPAYNAIIISDVVANITDNDSGPLPPVIPPPGGGVSEGNYSGSTGLANGNGKEGTFGFGRQLKRLQPSLTTPRREPFGALRVFNVTHQQKVDSTDGDVGHGVLTGSLLTLSALASAAVVFARRRPA